MMKKNGRPIMVMDQSSSIRPLALCLETLTAPQCCVRNREKETGSASIML